MIVEIGSSSPEKEKQIQETVFTMEKKMIK
jgi:hypothetical protein